MAVLFKDAEGVGYDLYLVDFQKQIFAPFWGGEHGEEAPSNLESENIEGFLTTRFSEREGKDFLKKVYDGLIVQVDFTERLKDMYEPEHAVAANDEVYEPKDGEVHFYRSPEGRGIAVDFFNGIWAPVVNYPIGNVKSLIHYPLSVPVNMSAYGGQLHGKLVPEMIKSGYVTLEKVRKE